jgi:DNA-binding transcriptional regulator YiaG
MKTTHDLQMRPFDVHIPNLDGDGIAETIRIEVPVRVDAETGDEILTPEAHELIEKTKARRMGLVSPDEMKQLRDRLGLTQEEMSDLLQIGAKTYTRWESGRARPSRSMNVVLCALRDGQLDVNYLRQLRDPDFSADWFTQNRARALFISSLGAIKPTVEEQFLCEAAANLQHWKKFRTERWPGFHMDMVVHVTDSPNESEWLFGEMKMDETIEIASMPRTIAPRPPEIENPWQAFRRTPGDPRQVQEAA